MKRSYGVMVSTLDFESSDPGLNPGRTSPFSHFLFFFQITHDAIASRQDEHIL